MATKLERISRLALETSRSITSSTQHWKRFLDSAARLYKYSFQDQVLIHAQKPEATACAEIGLWNERLHRWVNRGAKGIALIDTSEEKPHLRYVFDVSDTNSRQNIPFSLWQAKPEMYPRIAEELSQSRRCTPASRRSCRTASVSWGTPPTRSPSSSGQS